jgi:hypothetical protein
MAYGAVPMLVGAVSVAYGAASLLVRTVPTANGAVPLLVGGDLMLVRTRPETGEF